MRPITITEDSGELASQIEAALLRDLRAHLPQSLNTGFTLVARAGEAAHAELVGGLSASTAYGWLLIKTLWVSEAQRQRGIGAQLMHAAEAKGRALGCHAAWLDTSNPQAHAFYLKLGYSVFGELANDPGQQPETHRRWFMRKDLG
jgi:GNAT superfamily N-acetyltransferase